MRVNLSPRFKRAYKKLPPRLQDDFDAKIALFVKNPYYPLLRTHKLKGRLQECFAFCLQGGYRVLFEFAGPDAVDLLDAGQHDIYERFRH